MAEQMSSGRDLREQLYPFALQLNAPMPTAWNSKDKNSFMKLSHNNCRVQYKGPGKSHKDAAAVRANFYIPVACGLFYFEITIISKGRDGYIGIGLSDEGACLNRLPGWDKRSYGYHGDDGNSFASSGTGFPYGPTFATGDVIGCGVNMEDRTCFYTKNGLNLGITFSDLPLNLYPIVGLQTPGEIVEANFGQSPFVYNIMGDIWELRTRALNKLSSVQLPLTKLEWTRSVVSSYLIHQGYAKCAEEFNRLNGYTPDEPMDSVKLRQAIRDCIMNGQVSRAISLLEKHFPSVINNDLQMKHLLMCRQFIEIFSQNSFERSRLLGSMETTHSGSSSVSPSDISLWEASPVAVKHRRASNHSSPDSSPCSCSSKIKSPRSGAPVSPASMSEMRSLSPTEDASPRNGCEPEAYGNGLYRNTSTPIDMSTNDEDAAWDDSSPGQPMEIEDGIYEPTGGLSIMELEKVVAFGREVFKLSKELEAKNLFTDELKSLMHDAFSLLAYECPMQSPFSYLFEENRRIAICVIVNNAILKRMKYPEISKFEMLFKYASYLRKLLNNASVATAAFLDPHYLVTKKYPELGDES
uniref:B30.2/SPRY domain-containing protein n=1 Tax=Trichuris muris TaxID=70415 RepID=A0A5S6QF45_TRIMR